MEGILYVVATPIGNLEDITERAKRILSDVDLILAEDTRETKKLLDYFNIRTSLNSYHKFSEKKDLEKFVTMLEEGKDLAMVSDAGTPCVSDPGKFLVREVLEKSMKVVPVPGASAAISLFSVSGSESDVFLFGGFLPSTGSVRNQVLDKLFSSGVPFVLYESPKRITNLLSLLEGKTKRVVVGRELTKKFEEVFVYKDQAVTEKGEFAILVEPSDKEKLPDDEVFKLALILKNKGLSLKDICDVYEVVAPDVRKNALKDFFIKAGCS